MKKTNTLFQILYYNGILNGNRTKDYRAAHTRTVHRLSAPIQLIAHDTVDLRRFYST